jgi:glyoxylase-like metal-dependent hydrolase (beta-lactamase superfamily II)
MIIGNYEVQHIETGDFGLDGGAMFGVVPKTLWSRAYNPGDELNRIPMTARSLLLKGNNRLILVDTGCGNKMPEKLNTIYKVDYTRAALHRSLEQAGYSAADITDVILTHLHFDHAGGATERLASGALIPAFPNATYHVQKEHLAWAQAPTEKDRASFMTENWDPLIAEGILHCIEGAGELFPGIFVEPVYGHTQALQMVRIQHQDTNLLFPADLLPTAAHIPVPYVMGYDNHPLITMDEKRRVLQQAAEQNWIICFEHDSFTPAAKVQRTDKGFIRGEIIEI